MLRCVLQYKNITLLQDIHTRSEAHPASYWISIGSPFQGVKQANPDASNISLYQYSKTNVMLFFIEFIKN
jgi:uncharacterized protein YaeQ